MNIKIKDVYKFQYNVESLKNISYPYHCFDGMLVVKDTTSGLLLVDTYWNSDNKYFTLQEALEKGTLEYICNLDDVEYIKEYELNYYDDEDIINLSYQHSSYARYAILKGVKKSKNKMMRVLKDKLSSKTNQIESLKRDLISIEDKISKLETENVELEKIYL